MLNRSDPRRPAVSAILGAVLLLTWAPEVPGQAPDATLKTDLVEQIDVGLTILDVFVLDDHGHPVPDLRLDEFELIVDRKLVPLDTLDVACTTPPAQGPAAVRVAVAHQEQSAPVSKLVLALDYLHLDRIQRVDTIEQIKTMVQREAIGGYQLMLVALNGGVRIEQGFTDDRDAILASLNRMQNDPSLSRPDFYHQSSFVFINGLTALFDVLGSEPGNKAVVLFSTMKDVPLDSEFERIAAIAAASRSAIYPVDARGLTTAELSGVREDDRKTAARERAEASDTGNQSGSSSSPGRNLLAGQASGTPP